MVVRSLLHGIVLRKDGHTLLEGSILLVADEGRADAEDDPHLEEIKAWLESLGNPVGMIRPEDKTRYHCAAAVASNLVCGLVDFSMELLQMCGFS